MHRLMKTSSQCLLLWAETRVETPAPPGPKQTSVMQTSSHLGTVGDGAAVCWVRPTRPNCDLQIQNTNRMDWKQTRPTCYTYAPSRPMVKLFLLHLGSTLRKSGAKPLLPLHAFVAWTWKTLPLGVQLSKSA